MFFIIFISSKAHNVHSTHGEFTFLSRIISSFMSSLSLWSPVLKVKPATEGHIGRCCIITQLWNIRWCWYHATLHVQSAFGSCLLRLHLSPSLLLLTPLLILTHLRILSPLDPEWRCLCRLMLKVCLRSSGVTSHSDLSVWDASEKEADRERFEIFPNTNQYFVWLTHLTPMRASSLKVHLFKVSI